MSKAYVGGALGQATASTALFSDNARGAPSKCTDGDRVLRTAPCPQDHYIGFTHTHRGHSCRHINGEAGMSQAGVTHPPPPRTGRSFARPGCSPGTNELRVCSNVITSVAAHVRQQLPPPAHSGSELCGSGGSDGSGSDVANKQQQHTVAAGAGKGRALFWHGSRTSSTRGSTLSQAAASSACQVSAAGMLPGHACGVPGCSGWVCWTEGLPPDNQSHDPRQPLTQGSEPAGDGAAGRARAATPAAAPAATSTRRQDGELPAAAVTKACSGHGTGPLQQLHNACMPAALGCCHRCGCCRCCVLLQQPAAALPTSHSALTLLCCTCPHCLRTGLAAAQPAGPDCRWHRLPHRRRRHVHV